MDVESTLAEDIAPILHGRRRKRAVRPAGPFDGGEKATLAVDVGVVAVDDDAAPPDNEKYEGLSLLEELRCRLRLVLLQDLPVLSSI